MNDDSKLLPISVARARLSGSDLAWADERDGTGFRCSIDAEGRIRRLACLNSDALCNLPQSRIGALESLQELVLVNRSSQILPLPAEVECFFDSEFSELTSLRSLGVRRLRMEAPTIAKIVNSNGLLTTLGFPECEIGRHECREIAKLKGLLNLNLENNTDIDSHSIAYLAEGLEKLDRINLRSTGVRVIPTGLIFRSNATVLFE